MEGGCLFFVGFLEIIRCGRFREKMNLDQPMRELNTKVKIDNCTVLGHVRPPLCDRRAASRVLAALLWF